MNNGFYWVIYMAVHSGSYFYQKNKERLSLDSSENFMILLGDVGANFALTGQRDHKIQIRAFKIAIYFYMSKRKS